MQKIVEAMAEVELKSRPLKMVLMVCILSALSNILVKVSIDKLTAKAQKITIKLPWEIMTVYSEALRQSGHQSDDEEDEDDIEAHEASVQRLKVSHTGPSFSTCSISLSGS